MPAIILVYFKGELVWLVLTLLFDKYLLTPTLAPILAIRLLLPLHHWAYKELKGED